MLYYAMLYYAVLYYAILLLLLYYTMFNLYYYYTLYYYCHKVNVNGGAIAMGHPTGASGTRITGHLAHRMALDGLKYAVGSACIGGGQGIAVLLEAV